MKGLLKTNLWDCFAAATAYAVTDGHLLRGGDLAADCRTGQARTFGSFSVKLTLIPV